MTFKNQRGQAVVESFAALWILLALFFCLYYIFLIGLDKIRSLDTVYHLARVQEVQPNDMSFLAKAPLVMRQCFGRPGLPQNYSLRGSVVPMEEVTFQFTHHFSSSLLHPRQSVMRVAQPNLDYLRKSYPGAAEDAGADGWGPLGKEQIELVALAHGNQDSVVDAVEDLEAARQAEIP